jgi:hypothetical protein
MNIITELLETRSSIANDLRKKNIKPQEYKGSIYVAIDAWLKQLLEEKASSSQIRAKARDIANNFYEFCATTHMKTSYSMNLLEFFLRYISISRSFNSENEKIKEKGYKKYFVRKMGGILQKIRGHLKKKDDVQAEFDPIDISTIALIIVILASSDHPFCTEKKCDLSHATLSALSAEKYILTLVVSVKETEFVNILKSEGCLTPQTAERLFQSKQWLLYDTEENWKICQELFQNPSQEQDEDDVYFIKIMLNEPDRRLSKESSMVKMYDAFKELGQKKPNIEISERQPQKSYLNKGFYRV